MFSIQYAFFFTVVNVSLFVPLVPGASNCGKKGKMKKNKLDAKLRNTEQASEAVVHCCVISSCTKHAIKVHGNFPRSAFW